MIDILSIKQYLYIRIFAYFINLGENIIKYYKSVDVFIFERL